MALSVFNSCLTDVLILCVTSLEGYINICLHTVRDPVYVAGGGGLEIFLEKGVVLEWFNWFSILRD